MKPLISVILPTVNGSRYIRNAIESVKEQSYANWEFLVIDDGSTDATPSVVAQLAAQDPRIKYLKNDHNLGIQKALNRGLEEAKGEWIARIDDDDEWSDSHKLEKQIELSKRNDKCVLIGTGVTVVDANGRELFRYRNPETDAQIRGVILRKNCFAHSTVLFKRDVAMKVGGYPEDADTKHVEDYDLWLRMGQHGTMANLQTYSIKFMLSEQSISGRYKGIQIQRFLALTKKYGNVYPNYFGALVINHIRIVGFKLMQIMPVWLTRTLFKIYKKI